MKKAILLLYCLITYVSVNAQSAESIEDTGKVYGLIYSNFNYGLNRDIRSTAFEVTRAYFGFDRRINEYFSARVKLDIGSPDDLSEFSKLRRYAYFKNAGIFFSYGKFQANAGLFDMMQFKLQEKFWGYRYLYKSFMDEYKFGPSADIGLSAKYEFAEWFSADICISNGEGYTAPQRDETYKSGAGITLNPYDKLTLRTYYTIFMHDSPQMTLSCFAGYRSADFRIGAEFNYQKNYSFFQGHDRYGYSAYSTYRINNYLEIFGRYDHLFSNILSGDLIPWNLPEDGSAVIAGIQYTPVRNIRISLDYQDWVEYAGNGEVESYIYIHFEAAF